jgi:microsomal epoxide hydrolase
MERLGYARYGAQGGDWGAIVSTHQAAAHPERLVGLHLNLIIGRPPDPGSPLARLSPEEVEDVARTRAFNAEGAAYQRIQETQPQTLAYGLADSPVGLAAWILEKFRSWSDCGGDLEASYTKDRLLDNIMLYWATGTINSSMRLYYESNGPGRQTPYPARIETPTGHALFPAEIIRTPRPWAEQVYNIVRWTRMPRGGHFAAMEQPALFVDEVRDFFRVLRG